jgi:hypothetical protein
MLQLRKSFAARMKLASFVGEQSLMEVRRTASSAPDVVIPDAPLQEGKQFKSTAVSPICRPLIQTLRQLGVGEDMRSTSQHIRR